MSDATGKIDVRQLARENLARGDFPADRRADFRVHMKPEVLRGVETHAKADDSVEICGVLVGDWQQDEQGPFAAVTDYIRCDAAASKFAEVTFTHESWAQINKEMDSQFADKRIVGWYHSHPDFGIFLSDRDCFIQEHFFSSPGQVAYVIDPVRNQEGVFAWRSGKPTPLPFFWVGDQLHASRVGEERPPRDGNLAPRGMAPDAAATAHSAERPAPSLALSMLAWAGLFLLGYMYAGMLSRGERREEIEAAVARFSNTRVLKLGLDQDLDALGTILSTLAAEFGKLPEPGEKLTTAEQELAEKRRRMIADNLAVCAQAVASLKARYALSREELEALARELGRQQALLRLAPAGGGAPRSPQAEDDGPDDEAPAADAGEPAGPEPEPEPDEGSPAAPQDDDESTDADSPQDN